MKRDAPRGVLFGAIKEEDSEEDKLEFDDNEEGGLQVETYDHVPGFEMRETLSSNQNAIHDPNLVEELEEVF